MSRLPQDRPDIQVFAEIAAIDQLSTTRIERALPEGLTKAQFMVLDRLARRGGGENPAELARAFQLTKGALTNTLARLAAAGFITVRADKDDGRKKRVAVTEAGVAAHGEALITLRPITERARAAFPQNEFAAVLPFLRALRAWLQADSSDTARAHSTDQPRFEGMTTNERLFEAGLLRWFDEALARRDRTAMIVALNQVELADQAEQIADAVLSNPKAYGPRQESR